MYRRHTKEAESSFRKPSPELDNPFSGNGHVAEQLYPDTQYALLFEQHPQPMFVCDRESMKFLVVNEAAIRMYGFSREEFLQLTLPDIRPPEFISRFLESFAATDALNSFGRASPPGEWKHRKKDGTLFDVEIYCSRTTFQGRDARLGVVNDVSGRKQAEQALRENQERLEAALHASGTGTYRRCFKSDRILLDANLNRLLGLPADRKALKVEAFLERIHPEDRPRVTAQIRGCVNVGTDIDMEYRVVWPEDQTVHWLSEKGKTFFDAAGKPLYKTGACVDITARKLVEEKLREDEDRLRMILENVRDYAIFSLDLQGNITSWNQGAENVFGYSEPEIVGQPFAVIFTPEDRARGEPQYEITMAVRADFSSDDRWHLHKDGSRLFVSGTVRPVKDHQGRVQGFIKVARNITARKHVQDQLEARLQQQAAVARLGQVALAGGDEQALMDEAVVLVKQGLNIELSKVLELLPGNEQLFLRAGVGWKPGKVGQAMVPLGRESQAGYTLAADRPVISDDLAVEKRFKVLELLTEHNVHSSITVIIKGAENGQPYGVLGACSTQARKFSADDINFLQTVANVLAAAIQRKRSDEALGKSEQRFRELANAMPQIVWATRPDGQPEYYNERWFEYTGLSMEDSMSPFGWKKILHPDDWAICLQRWSDSLKSGEPYHVECRYHDRKSDGYRWYLVRAMPVKDQSGRIIRWFGSSTDVDQLKRITEALEEAQGKLRHYADDLEERVQERTSNLQKSIQSLEDVLYHVAHDLRAPLRAMQGLTTLLLEEYAPNFDTEGRDFAERIVTSAGRMDRLIRDLLAFGRLGHVRIACHQVDLERLLRSILESMEPEIRVKSATINIPAPLPSVCANETLLGQVLVNLVSNALKYVPAGTTPRLDIWSEAAGEVIRLNIQDNGIGIEPEHHQRVFRVFERLHRTEDYPGTGIGLAIVAKSMERMGGQVGLESQPGAGSKFWIELPGPARILVPQKLA